MPETASERKRPSFGTIFNCTVIAMVLFAATRIAEPFLTWGEWLPGPAFARLVAFVRWTGLSLTAVPDPTLSAERSASNLLSLLLVVSVTALYSTTGGLRAVVNTDVAQFAVALVATLVYALAVVGHAGGLSQLPEKLHALYGATWATETLAFTPTRARDAGWIVLGTIAIQWAAQMNADGTGYLAQRMMACRSDHDARRAAVVFTVAQILVRSLCWIPIGLGLLILMPMATGDHGGALVAAREATFVEGVARFLPAGVLGLMLTGMLAALASTIDTHLNWGASYWTNDIYGRLICQGLRGTAPTGRTLVWVARLSNLLILAVSIVILTRLESIQSAWKASLLLGAGMGVPLILRWIWWRMTAGAELAALVVSSLLAPLLLWAVDDEGSRMLLVTVATTVVVVGVSLRAPSAPSERVKEFYRRVHPPGFWAPVARACGEEPALAVARLRSGLHSTGSTALGIFCLLVGLGSWLFGSPAPTWCPWRGPWIASLLVVGAALLRRLRDRRWPDVHAGSRRPHVAV